MPPQLLMPPQPLPRLRMLLQLPMVLTAMGSPLALLLRSSSHRRGLAQGGVSTATTAASQRVVPWGTAHALGEEAMAVGVAAEASNETRIQVAGVSRLDELREAVEADLVLEAAQRDAYLPLEGSGQPLARPANVFGNLLVAKLRVLFDQLEGAFNLG